MKKIFTFLILCNFYKLLLAQSYDIELINPKPIDENILDISFVNDTLGFLLTENKILKTIDDGENWSLDQTVFGGKNLLCKKNTCISIEKAKVNKYDLSTESWKIIYNQNDAYNEFTSLSIVDDSIYYAASPNKLYKTTDGGKSWDINPINFDVNNISFINNEKGFFTTNNGFIGMTLDAGKSWEIVYNRSNTIPSGFHSIYFINDQIGLATLGHGDLLRTKNGGITWNVVKESSYKANRFFFVNETEGFLTTEYGKLYYSKDAGLTWERRDIHESYYQGTDLKGIYFKNKNEGFIGGLYGRLYKTTDNGMTSKQYGATYNDVKDFYAINNKFYLNTNREFLTSTDSQTWVKNKIPSDFGISKMKFIDEKTALGVFYRDNNYSTKDLYKTIDGGETWRLIGYTSIINFEMFDAKNGVSLDNYGKVFYTTDGGNSFQETSKERLTNFQKVGNTTFSNTYNMYPATIYTSSNNGKTWDNLYSFPEADIYDMNFISEQKGFVVGRYDSNFKTIDGGKTWTKLDIPYEWYKHVNFFNEKIGIIIDEDGLFYLTKDGGESWQYILSKYFLNNSYYDGKHVYLTGLYGKVYKMTIDDLSVKELLIDSNNNFSLYPNPTKGKLTIKLSNNLSFLKGEVYNFLGQKVLEVNSGEINASKLVKGIYILKLYTKEGKILSKKFIKE
ncbi:T9SS type A sorting domain-containing protein [Empedobacter brevis]|uniref:T9SS type A sorting domain-containing protein n=1 Tax=Empedobacter brevis TaxID=247 RepID=UPI00289631A2|nr:YCF48-related protein [Empedobacter brevis]